MTAPEHFVLCWLHHFGADAQEGSTRSDLLLLLLLVLGSADVIRPLSDLAIFPGVSSGIEDDEAQNTSQQRAKSQRGDSSARKPDGGIQNRIIKPY